MLPDGIRLRPVTDADFEFLCGLYASTRQEELAQLDWSEEARLAFLRSQFVAQCDHYEKYYFDAERSVIERDGTPVGRLYVYRGNERDIRIVDIALVPEARGSGIGTALLTEVMSEVAGAGKTVSIHVERFNRALRLYERLGFEHVDEHGVYYLMRWTGKGSGGSG